MFMKLFTILLVSVAFIQASEKNQSIQNNVGPNFQSSFRRNSPRRTNQEERELRKLMKENQKAPKRVRPEQS